jgi:hypothetical protein
MKMLFLAVSPSSCASVFSSALAISAMYSAAAFDFVS